MGTIKIRPYIRDDLTFLDLTSGPHYTSKLTEWCFSSPALTPSPVAPARPETRRTTPISLPGPGIGCGRWEIGINRQKKELLQKEIFYVKVMNGTWNNCLTIPSEPNIFKPGFLPDILDKYVIKERLEEYSYIQRTQIVYQGIWIFHCRIWEFHCSCLLNQVAFPKWCLHREICTKCQPRSTLRFWPEHDTAETTGAGRPASCSCWKRHGYFRWINVHIHIYIYIYITHVS